MTQVSVESIQGECVVYGFADYVNDHWLASGKLVYTAGRGLAIQSVTFTPDRALQVDGEGHHDEFALDPGGHGVTGTLLREFSPSRVLEAARTQVRYATESVLDDVNRHGYDLFDAGAAIAAMESVAVVPSRKGGRPRQSEDLLRAFVLRCLDAQDRGLGPKPIQAIAKMESVAPITVKKRLARAREHGLLQPTTVGRFSLDPGPNLFRSNGGSDE